MTKTRSKPSRPAELKPIIRWRSRTEALKALYGLFNYKDRALITIDPDPDSIASAMALKRLLWRHVQSTAIGIIRPIKRLNNLTMVRLLKLPLVQLNEKNIKDFDKYLLVDGQPSHQELFQKVPYTAVIDHHPVKCEPDAPFVDIRPHYGAVSTMMTEYLRTAAIKPSQTLATALIYGIKTDTRNFERQTLQEDVKAFLYLFGRANHNILRKIEISDLSLRDLALFKEAIENKTVSRDRIYAHLEKVNSPDILVIIAEFMLKVHDISWSIVSGVHGDQLVVIVRNDGYRKDAGKAVTRAFSGLGSAGGHKAMARAEIPIAALDPLLQRKTPTAIARFVKRRFAVGHPASK
jgi:nanoRNase/pAp phosphatase (c-di-AMP/oligoRNAs hydrolase)